MLLSEGSARMKRKSLGYSSLLLFVVLVSVGLAQDAVHDADAVKRLQGGTWSIALGAAKSKNTYEFKETQTIVLKGVPCYVLNLNTPAGKKTGIYTVMKSKGQAYLFFGWPVVEGNPAERLEKRYLLDFNGPNEFELHTARDDPDKLVCTRK
jgi:hypothetical protein